ncbi:hypothetical protein NKH10_19435 [Mesorhizobium sp. M1340]|uniref:hypothetical protein n=1 Tax=Mesorhizobium sp. M1340 TaxID=2957087 RepID=UPI00333CE7D6
MRQGKHDQTELHRVVFAGLDQSIIDKAAVAFFAIPPADRAEFVARVNKILDGRGSMTLAMRQA